MRDNYGDQITIEDNNYDIRLSVDCLSNGYAVAALSPDKARKLAKKLRKAADELVPRETEDAPTFVVGDKVRVSDDPWVSEPGGFVASGHAGALGIVVGFDLDAVGVEVAGFGQLVDPSCLTKVEDPTYTLTLTQEQAETLAVILGKIGGPHGRMDYKGRDSARTHASDVLDALKDAGIDVYNLEGRPEYALDDAALGNEKHAIYFAPYAK